MPDMQGKFPTSRLCETAITVDSSITPLPYPIVSLSDVQQHPSDAQTDLAFVGYTYKRFEYLTSKNALWSGDITHTERYYQSRYLKWYVLSHQHSIPILINFFLSIMMNIVDYFLFSFFSIHLSIIYISSQMLMNTTSSILFLISKNHNKCNSYRPLILHQKFLDFAKDIWFYNDRSNRREREVYSRQFLSVGIALWKCILNTCTTSLGNRYKCITYPKGDH